LKDCPDPSCSKCYPPPTTIPKEFDTFYRTIIQYQDIINYTGRTVELFEKYNQETDLGKKSQLAVTVAVSLAYGKTYWEGTANLVDIVDLIEDY
jgi:hypothetical protein